MRRVVVLQAVILIIMLVLIIWYLLSSQPSIFPFTHVELTNTSIVAQIVGGR